MEISKSKLHLLICPNSWSKFPFRLRSLISLHRQGILTQSVKPFHRVKLSIEIESSIWLFREYSWNRGTASRQTLDAYESRPWSLQTKNWHCYTAAAFAVMKIAILAGRSDQLWMTLALASRLYPSSIRCRLLVVSETSTVGRTTNRNCYHVFSDFP